MTGVLEGTKVLDLGCGLAGSVAALLLAEAGAEVIRLEPRAGDPAQTEPAYAVWNRSKRRTALDLPAERARLDALLADADVVFLDKTPADLRRLDLDPERLAHAWPRLVVCSIAGFPAGHPLEETPVRDTLVLAELGLLDEQAAACRGGPIHLRFPLGSWCAAYLAANGAMARLLTRQKDGHGGVVRTSLAQGALVPMAMHWFKVEKPTESLNRGIPKAGPNGLFECGDGAWIHIMRCPDQTPLMARELAAMAPDEQAALVAAAPTYGMLPLYGANAAIFKRHPSRTWLEEFWTHDIPAQPAQAFGALYGDPECVLNDYVVEVEDPQRGRTRQPGPPMAIDPPMQVQGPLAVVEADAAWRSPRAADESATADPCLGLPLEGLRVLDFGSHLAGPLAPMLMADLGADVIKVEPPKGDVMRQSAEGAVLGCQRNKRGLTLELKDPSSADALRRLVAGADVVHHNMRMPAAHKLGLDYERLKAIKPDLIYSHVSTYGPKGARKDWPGMDQMVQAMTGWEQLGAGEGNAPHWHRFGFMDHLAAMGSLLATLLALYRRNRTGEGQATAASLLGAGMLTTGETIEIDGRLTPVVTLNHDQTGVSPGHGVYLCADGWIALAATEPGEIAAVAALAGGEGRDQVEALLAPLSREEALARLKAAGAPCAPVRTDQREAFLASPENRKARLATVYPSTRYGRVEHVGGFWTFPEAPIRLDSVTPAIGEHNAAILTELGLASAGLVEA